MSVWSYDGGHVVSVTTTLDDADQTSSITCNLDESNSSEDTHFGGSIGDTVTITPSPGVGFFGGMSPGDLFIANLYYPTTYFDTDFGSYTRKVTKEARLFVYGTAGAGVAYVPSISFSGTTVTVTLEIDQQIASGTPTPFGSPSPPFFAMFASDCNSTGWSEGSPGPQGTTITRSINDVGHCDTSPFGAGESFVVQIESFNEVIYYAKVTVVAGLTADFSGTPRSGAAPLVVAFTDLTAGGTPTSWSWDFGDGGTSSAQNPTHTYTSAGSYTVSLTASDGGSTDAETKLDYIVVGPARTVVITTRHGFKVDSS